MNEFSDSNLGTKVNECFRDGGDSGQNGTEFPVCGRSFSSMHLPFTAEYGGLSAGLLYEDNMESSAQKLLSPTTS